MLRVHGKGRRNRTVPVPAAAMAATREYFDSRRLPLDLAPVDAPLIAALNDSMKPITYAALHETFTRFVRRSLGGLSAAEKGRAQRASAHWLRHTHATRAAERGVPLDVLQENLGQSDTTGRRSRGGKRSWRGRLGRGRRSAQSEVAQHDRRRRDGQASNVGRGNH